MHGSQGRGLGSGRGGQKEQGCCRKEAEARVHSWSALQSSFDFILEEADLNEGYAFDVGPH